MKDYPSIPSAADLLARPDHHLGRPFVAFDKLDGSNIRGCGSLAPALYSVPTTVTVRPSQSGVARVSCRRRPGTGSTG